MRTYIYLITITLILSLSGCASKKYANKAKKFDEAGLYRDAAQMYFQSVAANGNNIEAKLGLQRTGQLLLMEKIESFKTHYNNRADKEAVYAYIDAEKYFLQVQRVGVKLNFPPENSVYYNESKERYLGIQYNEALKALDMEEFQTAENLLSEITSIDPSFKDAKTHWITAHYEPIYRKGISFLDNRLFRSAYYSFNEIVTGVGTYKDAITLKSEALHNATITIAVAPFSYQYTLQSGVAQSLRSKTISELNAIKSPFYKVATDDVIAALPADGKKSLPALIIPYLSTFRQSIQAKTVLIGHISKFIDRPGSLKKTEKQGYLKRDEETTDDNGLKKTITIYEKVTYQQYSQINEVTIVMEFSLIDVRTGNIVATDLITVPFKDEINYASYAGDSKKLIPGYWKYADKKAPEDNIQDNNESITQLRNLLAAKKEIRSTTTLTAEAVAMAARQIANAIENYNPER